MRPDDGRELLVCDTPADVARAGAALVAGALREAAAEREGAVLALSGGDTPRPLYERLATAHRDDVPWPRVTIVYGDDRCVPPDDPASNHRLARETLLARVPLDPARVHRVRGELPPAAAAADYERTLRRALGGDQQGSDERAAGALDLPLLDVNLLGMGTDGHTASLFPHATALGERARWAVAVEPPDTASPSVARVTLTLPVLQAARLALVVVTGASKAGAVRAALHEPPDPARPAGLVRALGRTVWLLDAAAAAGLDVPAPTG